MIIIVVVEYIKAVIYAKDISEQDPKMNILTHSSHTISTEALVFIIIIIIIIIHHVKGVTRPKVFETKILR